jgi:hypothetical protein
MRRSYITGIISIFLTWSASSATIINIPDDYPAIQQGIDASSDGDTVLVQPGIYTENIDFIGRNIVLGSLFLTTGDAIYIQQTIIDGNSSGAAISMISGEDSTAKVTGVTVQNGSDTLAGGIICVNCSPRIEHNIIVFNQTDSDNYNSGAGIYCENSNAFITNNEIRDNRALSLGAGGIFCLNASPLIYGNKILDNIGGGIHCYTSSSPLIERNIICGNSTLFEGGGISCFLTSPTLINNTIYGNSAGSTGGGINIIEADPQITNCIFWDNAPSQIYLYFCSPDIRYCDVGGGWEGEGNIDCDPMFCAPQEHDYRLAENSCCVGTGENGEDIGAYGVECESSAIFDEDPELPLAFTIEQNYPNPFNLSTVITYSLPEYKRITLNVYDLLGRKAITLADEYTQAGTHRITFDASGLPSGIYLCILQGENLSETRRMVLLR